jgi:hypothetical protein
MRLILEGIDGVGKSTILEKIEKTHRVKSIHLVKPPKGVTPHKWSDYFRESYDSADLLSRSHISERVYGNLSRNRSLIDDWQNWLLNLQLEVRGFHIAYIVRDLALVEEQIKARGTAASDYDLWVVDHYFQMGQAYEKFLPRHLTTWIHNVGQLDQAVSAAAVVGNNPLFTSPHELRGIGSLTPKVIIVGDEFTIRRRAFAHAKPFDFGEASKLLFEALNQLRHIYITNSLYPDLGDIRSQFQLGDELRRFAGAKIIALGVEAAKRLKRAGFEPNQIIPHPQYWRRFKYADRGSYVNDLRQVAENFHG